MKIREKHNKKNSGARWTATVTVLSFVLTVLFSFLAESVTEASSVVLSVLIILALIVISIIADIVGTAVTVCDAMPLAAMSSRKVRGARSALKLIHNSEKVASICCDVIGDICGIVTGAAATAIVYMILSSGGSEGARLWISILISASVACLTIGGKAFGKKIAHNKSKEIVYFIGRMLSITDKTERAEKQDK